jgi:hypothetical protein
LRLWGELLKAHRQGTKNVKKKPEKCRIAGLAAATGVLTAAFMNKPGEPGTSMVADCSYKRFFSTKAHEL